MIVDGTQFTQLKLKLKDIVGEGEDSLRFYQLGNNYKSKIEHLGVQASLDMEGSLIF